MSQALAIAAGGAAGALLRYWVSLAVYGWVGRDFPYGTLAVNVLGSFVMGMMFVLLIERISGDGLWRAAILIGLLGAFTTFSTFSIETLNLVEAGAWFKAAVNVLASVVLCLAGGWLGLVLGRMI